MAKLIVKPRTKILKQKCDQPAKAKGTNKYAKKTRAFDFYLIKIFSLYNLLFYSLIFDL